jgi:hypothetical protein
MTYSILYFFNISFEKYGNEIEQNIIMFTNLFVVSFSIWNSHKFLQTHIQKASSKIWLENNQYDQKDYFG